MAGDWPIDELDVAALTLEGWRPVPFRQFILKLHSRCNLACDYCYIYKMGDATWRRRPPVISDEVIESSCRRIAEHARSNRLSGVQVALHGGEPLLAGPTVVTQVARTLRSQLPAGTTLSLRLQTNGVLLDELTLELLLEFDIQVGVSLDGDQQHHDAHRRSASGRGSYRDTARAIRLLSSPRYRSLFAGLLCVIDPDTDPLRTYTSLLSFAPPAIDFLLPHGNWSAPPPQRPANGQMSPYGDWLIAVFDHWYGAPKRETHIRIFEEIMSLALGGSSRTEYVGLSPVSLVVVDTDGSLEQVDTLRSVHDGASATGLTVFRHSFDELLRHPAIVARQIGAAALGDKCSRCRIRGICGGGYYPHRYRRGSGFRHASVYCPDLLRLIDHIVGRMRTDIAGLRERIR